MSETKKLSLEERLNLAAQKRRRPKKQAGSTEDLAGQVTVSSSKESLVEAIDSELNQWVPEDISGIDRAELIRILDQHFVEFKQNFKSVNSSNNDTSVLKLVKGKDVEIDELKKSVEKFENKEHFTGIQIGKLKEAVEEARSTRDQLIKELEEVLKEKDSLVAKLQESEKNIELKSEEVKRSNEQQNKIKDLEAELTSEKGHSQRLNMEVERLRSAIEAQKVEFRNEVTKNEKVSSELITSLESQLEQLRIELENKNNEETSNVGTKDNSYAVLKEQFQSSKSNWASIESILNSKISSLEDSIEHYKRNVKKLETQLDSKTTVLLNVENLLEEEKKSKREIEEKLESLSISSSALKHEIENLKEDYNLLEKKYEAQRNNIKQDSSFKNLEPAIAENGANEWNDFRTEIDPIESIEEHIDNISIGSGSEIVDTNSAQDILRMDESSIIQDDSRPSDIIFPEDADALEEMNLQDKSFRRLSAQISNSVGQTNTHLVTKLGNEIRRLESEITTLNEKIERLQREKSLANEEILKLIEKNNDYNDVLSSKEKLEEQVKELEGKLDTTLQILGEKTERVDELQNDVLDLKDMLHEQVKQMVDLQDKLR